MISSNSRHSLSLRFSFQVRSVNPRWGELPCIGTLEANFEGLEGGEAQGFVQARAVEVQAELSVNMFDVEKVGDMVKTLEERIVGT
jgi:hypothetical protein